MKRSQRGAARISAVWMIAVIVAFFVALAVAFIAFDEAKNFEEETAQLRERASDAEAKVEVERDHIRAMSEMIGYYDEAGSAKADIETMKEGLSSMRDAFPDMDPSISTFQKALPVAITSFNSRGTKLRDLETKITELTGEVSSKVSALRELTSSKDAELTKLRSDIADLEQAKNDQQATLEKQVASVRTELTDSDTKFRDAQDTIDQGQRTYDRDEQTWRTRFAEMSSKIAFTREPEASDGEILAVSKDLALGWVNRGAQNRLARGTRFRVVAGDPADATVKAWAEVTRVEADLAEVRFFNQSDPFNPPVTGDTVFNPLYDPLGDRNAVLVGRFSGTFNEKELAALLAEMGISVQKNLDLTTDYLIVGAEIYTDPDTEEPLEEPLQPSDLPVYKDAVASGVSIVAIKDIRQYFKN